MDRKPVTSSNIKSVGYDPATKTLEVEFLSGSLYRHEDVPQHVYDEFMAADSNGRSVGSHYNYNVKRFKGSKVS
jgi:hypothetical protein